MSVEGLPGEFCGGFRSGGHCIGGREVGLVRCSSVLCVVFRRKKTCGAIF